MKLKSLSIVAAGAILGLGLLSGCGSSSNSATAGGSGISGSDGYVIKLDTNATAFCSDTNTTYTSAATVGARGALTFPGVTLTNLCTVTIPADAWIDADNSGDFNATKDKRIGFSMRAPGDAKFVSHLTELAVASGNAQLMTYVKDFDPVLAAEAATSSDATVANKAKKLLILGEAVKTALTGGSIDEAKKIVVTDILDVNKTSATIDTTTMTASVGGAAKAAMDDKIAAMQALVAILADLKASKVDITDAVVQISDGGKTLTQALIADGNKTLDVNTSAKIAAIDSNITTATTTVSNLPAKLSIGSLKLGNQTVALNGNTFNTTVNTATSTISDFYNVSFPSVALNKSFAQQTVGVSVRISDAHSNQVTLSVAGAKLSPNDTNTSVKISLPTTATVSFSETGLTALQAALGATSATTSITSALNPTDLSFNVDTILDSIGSSNIPAGLAALNNYLKASGVYDVNITFSGLNPSALTTDYTSFVGKVTVKGDVTAPTAPTLGTLTASSLVVTAEAGSTIVIKNGSTTLATATATGSAQTVSFTALTASATLSVTATDKVGNVSVAATKAFTYTAPDTTAPAAPTLGAVTASSLVVTAETGSTITIKNGSTTLATATATGAAQTITFTALTADATLSVTATDSATNVSTIATKAFTYVAPAVTFNVAMVNDVVNGTLGVTSNTSGSYTLKAKTSAATPTGTVTANQLWVKVNSNTSVQVPIHTGYTAGTNFQIGVYSGSTLVAVSSIYTLTQADINAGETIGDIAITF